MYAKVVSGVLTQYPYTDAQLRADNPDTSFALPLSDATRAAFEMLPVQPAAKPVDPTMDITEGTPAFVGGVWQQVWNQTPADPAVVAARLVAAKEDKLREVSARRLQAENAGVMLGGNHVATTPEFRDRLRELRDWLNDNPGQQVPVRLADGRVFRVGLAQLTTARTTIAAHIRACIEAEAAHIDAVDALADIPSVNAYDYSGGWPA